MRRPVTVLVLLFRMRAGAPEFAVLRRADDGAWQGVSGGVEGDESLVAAALREVEEETGLRSPTRITKLDMRSGVDRSGYAADSIWPDGVYIVEKHFFGMEFFDGAEIKLSREHGTFRWVDYEEVRAILSYQDERTALWELNRRIARNDFIEVSP